MTFKNQRVKIGYFVCNPVDNTGSFFDENYDKAPSIFPFGVKTQLTAFAKDRNMPSEIIGKEMKDWIDFGCRGNYFNMKDVLPNGTFKRNDDRDFTLNHVRDNINWLTTTLQYQEALRYKFPEFINADGTHRNLGTYMLFVQDGDNQKYYVQDGVTYHSSHAPADVPLPDEIAEGVVTFYKFSGANGMLIWDYMPNYNLLPKIGLKPVKNGRMNDEYFRNTVENNPEVFANKRIYSSVEAAIHANWRLFATEARHFFEGKSIYLNEKTEVDYGDGEGFQQLNAVQLAKQDKIFVRAIVQNNQILIAAQKPYCDENYKTKFKVRYKNWEKEFSFEGKFPKIWAVKME